MRTWSFSILLVVILLAVGALACDLPGGGKPTIVVNSPPSNYEINEGEELGVEVSATGGGNIDRVELWVDDTLVNTAANPSPQPLFNARLIWVASGLGSHTVQVRAYNTDGKGSDPVAVVVIVEQGIAVATATSEIGPFATETATMAPATATPTNTPAPPTPTPTATSTLPPACPGAPVIPSFYADPSTITAGNPSTLYWGLVANATSASIDQGIGGVGTPGSVVVSPGSTTTYTMTATGCGGTVTKQATITVNPAGPTVLLDFVAAAPSARWYVGTCPGGGGCNYIEDVPWCGPGGDPRGSACYADGIQLENLSVLARVLGTHPRWEDQGHIAGEYPNLVTIQAGDRFKAQVGYAYGAGGSDGVTFRIIWAEAADGWLSHVIQEVGDTYDGSLKTFDVDLSSIAGKTVKFRLHVKAGPTSGQDWAIWLNPRVERP